MTDPCYVRIVEDSSVLIEMLSVTFDLEGVRYCTTGSNFTLLLSPEPWEGITVALCDLDLGGAVTGEMVLEYLKGELPWIKRVVLSAMADVASERIRSLANVVLTKPADLRHIMEAIK